MALSHKVLTATALGATVAGCSGDGEKAAPSTTAQPPPPAAEWATCENTTFAFTIEYPPTWYTTPVGRGGECLLFEPEPFEIPEASDLTGAAIEVQPAQESYANVLTTLTDEQYSRVLQRRDVTVAGRDAVRVEAEATGEGLLDAGTRTTTYVVDREGQAFLVLTTAVPRADYEARKRVLDRAARGLRFTGPLPERP